ncbi:MAG TPA: response regulator [Burkholderiales bacterium]|nr:response regulator [Burkholderiales bacterium]
MPQTDASLTAKAPPRALRVVVVEDEADTLRTLVELVRTEGHIAEGARTSKEFWRLFHTIGPDVCLVDIGLPDRSGYDIAQEMSRRYGTDRPKLVAVTGWIKASDRILARIAGFDRHVAKPYDPAALLALVADITQGSAQ